MADQGKWFKLWCSSLDDQCLEDLSIHDWFCWVRLGAYIKKQGKDGTLTIVSPARALVNLFRVSTFDDVIATIKRLPNCTLRRSDFTVSPETLSTVSYEFEFKNWFKYQHDFSSDRVRNFRARKAHRETAQEEKRSRRDVEVEEKRLKTTKQGAFTKPSALEVTAYAKTIGFELDGQRFCDHYEANGWKVGRNPMRSWQAAVRTWKNRNPGDIHAPNGSPRGVSYKALARAKRADEESRTIASPREVIAGVGNLSDVQAKTGPDR
ncbi:MAG: hypothetical protein ACHQ1H_06930 [Nitrososphaerales archaeon]